VRGVGGGGRKENRRVYVLEMRGDASRNRHETRGGRERERLCESGSRKMGERGSEMGSKGSISGGGNGSGRGKGEIERLAGERPCGSGRRRGRVTIGGSLYLFLRISPRCLWFLHPASGSILRNLAEAGTTVSVTTVQARP
jgi:hypothetical protein